MILIASYYLAGIACLLVLDYTDQLSLAGMAGAVRAARFRKPADETLPAMWHVPAPRGEEQELAIAARLFYLVRPNEYVGRHRAAVVGWNEPTQSLFLPPEDEAPLCPPMYPRYAYGLGVGRYAHLRMEEMDAAAERDVRRLKPHGEVNLTALRLRTSTMPRVDEHDDEWAAVG